MSLVAGTGGAPDPIGSLVLALLAAFWAGTSAVFTGMKMLMDRSDAIVAGRAGDRPLDVTHRRRILQYEWVPLRAALGLISLMLGIVMLSLPALAHNSPKAFGRICLVAAIVPFLGAAYFLLGGVVEYIELRRRLTEL